MDINEIVRVSKLVADASGKKTISAMTIKFTMRILYPNSDSFNNACNALTIYDVTGIKPANYGYLKDQLKTTNYRVDDAAVIYLSVFYE